jgi:hypothetical protein
MGMGERFEGRRMRNMPRNEEDTMIMMMVDIIATVVVMIVIILMTIITTTGVDIDEGTITVIDHTVCHPLLTTDIMSIAGEGRRNSKLNMARAQIIITGTIEDCRDHTTEKIVIMTNMKVDTHIVPRGIGVVEVVIDGDDDDDAELTAIGGNRMGMRRKKSQGKMARKKLTKRIVIEVGIDVIDH